MQLLSKAGGIGLGKGTIHWDVVADYGKLAGEYAGDHRGSGASLSKEQREVEYASYSRCQLTLLARIIAVYTKTKCLSCLT